MENIKQVVQGVLAFILISFTIPLSLPVQSSKPIIGSGNANVQSFDEDW
jgi:hypothetical protein